MKILYYVQTESDYGHDVIYDGLCRVLGHENVLEYPHKPNYHGKPTGRHLHYPCNFDYPVTKSDDEKIGMLFNNEFDVTIVTYKIREEGNRFSNDFFELLVDKSKEIPTYIVDQGDRQGFAIDLYNELNCKGYFKRELITTTYGVTPLNYCYSEKYVPDNIDTERTIDLFWAGSCNSYRKKFLNAVGAGKERYTQEEYRKKLLESKIGLCMTGFGWDTVRYYEIPAHGTLLLTQRVPIIIENNFVDGESAVFYDTPEELKEKLQYLLDNPDVIERIRHAGHEHFKKYHTSEVRARQLLKGMGYES